MVAWISRLQTKRLFAPGTAWGYSNSNYVLLGKVIEQASGASLQDFFQRRLFAPAGLKDTAFDDPTEVVPRRVQGYRRARGSPPASRMRIGSAPAFPVPQAAYARRSTTCFAGVTRSTAAGSSTASACS
jgi:CubicO group peptidase (beta-lactamase class C family)